MAQMSELQATLEDLGLQEYLSRLVEHGFDTLDNLAGITETDMATLRIKLGHRRRLQRENSRRLGHPANEPLFDLPAATPQVRGKYTREDGITSSGSKRRCRRLLLRDPHILPRPDTGYAVYTRFLCQDQKVSNLLPIEIAEYVRKRWSSLSGELKDTWNAIGASQKDTHNSQLEQHYQTEAPWIWRGSSESGELLEDQRDAQVNCNDTLPETSRSGLPWSVANVQAIKDSTTFFEVTHQPPSELVQSNSTASASTTYTLDETIVSPSSHRSSPTTSTCGSAKADFDVPVIESIWKIISQEQASYPAVLPVQLSRDDLLSCTCQRPARSNSLHVKTINPFEFKRRSMISPLIDSFLRNVNSIYYLINPDDLWNHLESALDTTLETSNMILSAVCVCVALGCQNYHTDATDMAIMWYENGRRYLDDRDWCLDPAVMQVLALISMFHMAQRPATSRHYLDAAMRIGDANNLHKPMKQTGDSSVLEWLGIWNTIQTMHRILLLGSGIDGSILRISQSPPHGTIGPPHDTRAQSTVAAIAFGELSYTLGCVQQQLGQSNALPLWRAGPFMAKLKTWLYSLPDELSLPVIPKTESWDLVLMKDILSKASDGRKVELLHLYSLYFGVIGLLTTPSLQQIVAAHTEQPLSALAETESYAYECLNSALQLIDLCTALSHVSLFPIYAWLPQCVLFTSSLACTLGIIWQRQVLVRDTSASQKWLKRSHDSIYDALVIFRHCATGNEQAQRHYRVLEQIFRWLQSDTYNLCRFTPLSSSHTCWPQLYQQLAWPPRHDTCLTNGVMLAK